MRLYQFSTKPREGRHDWDSATAGTFTNLLYHVVFSTKNRRPMITPKIEPALYAYIDGIVRGQDAKLTEIGSMPDHIHLLVQLKPIHAPADIVRLVKANSAKWANEEHRTLGKFGWQDGYAAFTVSQSAREDVRAYIQRQKEHHGRRDFQGELRALLVRHAVAYEERYLE